MAVRMRLQRFGKKGQPFYHIVVADGRAPRDGRFIEKLGYYNPRPNPADIEINMDRAIYWLNVGAQPTDTVKSLLSYKGVLLKRHLLKGVEKGAITLEQAEEKFNAWLQEKEARISAKLSDAERARRDAMKARQEQERKIAEARAAEIAKKRAEAAAQESAEDTPAEPTGETPAAE
ncbi:MAG: 30S ribosomal protein S16 [Bacteroidales bacterium]